MGDKDINAMIVVIPLPSDELDEHMIVILRLEL